MTTFVGSAKGTNTATAPAHAIGDLMLVVATRNASATAPSLPAGFTNIGTSTVNTNSIRAGFKICTSTSDATGTWTNATECVVHIYRPTSGSATGIGAHAFAGGSSVTASYTGLTLVDTSGNSWIAAFGQTKTQSVGISTAPSTFSNTNGQDELGTGELASFDTNGTVSSSATHTVTITSAVWKTFVVEILDIPAPTTNQYVVQEQTWPANPVGVGNSGDSFKLPITNPVGSGNCLVLDIEYPHGATPSISDTVNGAWSGTPAATLDAGVGGYILSSFLFPNATSGQTTVTVSFGAAQIPFSARITEYCNVATTSPANGTSTNTSVCSTTTSLLTCGSFTPGNNNANGGNIVRAAFSINGAAGANPIQFIPAGGFELTDGDVSWSSTQGFPKAAMHTVQTTSAAVNPSMLAEGDTVNSYNCVALALKIDTTKGTPRSTLAATNGGIFINKITHQTYVSTDGTTWNIQVPCTGNLRVFEMSLDDITAIVDSEGGTNANGAWTKITMSTGGPPIWYSVNKGYNPNFWIRATNNSGRTGSLRFYDISGADPNPFDVSATLASTDVSNLTSLSNAPSITPTFSTGVTIGCMELGNGPGLSVTAPTGAVWDLCTYATEIDTDLLENADCCGHFYYSNTTTQNWAWTFTLRSGAGSNSAIASAACFKAAPISSGQVPYTPWPQLGPTLAQ